MEHGDNDDEDDDFEKEIKDNHNWNKTALS